MRMRQILLAHPTRSIRALIKKYVFSELGDIEFVEAENGKTALAELEMHSFDVVVAAEMQDIAAVELKAKLGQTQYNAGTPFIMLSEDESGQDLEMLAQQGFEHVVQLRVRPADLIRTINKVCNPRHWRKDRRYYIPNTKVVVDTASVRFEGTLINVSQGGVLMALSTHAPEGFMGEGLHVTFRIPGQQEPFDIGGLPCKLLRLEVTGWHPNHAPAAMRATLVFLELSEEQSGRLEQLLQLAVDDKVEHSA